MSVQPSLPAGFDSVEEVHLSWWLEELVEAGYVARWARGRSYDLAPAITQEYWKERTSPSTGKPLPAKLATIALKKGLSYTPDFEVHWTIKAIGLFYVPHQALTVGPPVHHFIAHPDEDLMPFSLLEVKPRVAGRSTMNTGRFSISRMNCMILYKELGLYTNLIEVGTQPGSIFSKTFTPDRFLTTDKSGKPRTIKFQPRDLSGFVAATPKLKIRTQSNE
jgi:hypothetical protein